MGPGPYALTVGATRFAHAAATLATEGGRSFALDFTYDVHVLHLASDPDRAGSLTHGTYYYVVTAVTGQGETLVSNETSKIVGDNGAIQLYWGKLDAALPSRPYPATTPAS